MHKGVTLLLGTVVICGGGGLGWAANGEPFPGTDDPAYEVTSPAGDVCACNGCECVSGRGCRGCQHRLAQKFAEAGYFNCRCRGSYKYPVLPQYTYHWPGMYSQRTMTEYSSPYRFPPLRSPAEVSGQTPEEPDPEQTAGLIQETMPTEPNMLPNLAPSNGTAQPPATTSQRMKRLYGMP